MVEQFSNYQDFDSAAASEALGVESRSTHDVAHGDGEAMRVSDTVLEVYPAAGVARVTTPDARVELYRVPRYTVSGERVVFEQGPDDNRSRLQVRADGKVAFHPVLRGTEPPRTSETAPGGRQDSSARVDTPETTTGPSATPEDQEVPQVQLRGRLGRDAWYNDQGEQPIGGFPLAVNDERGGTTWHRVVVFGDTALQLQESHAQGSIRKGRMVDVTGRTVVREDDRPGGGVKKSVEFHASAVARVQASRTRPSR